MDLWQLILTSSIPWIDEALPPEGLIDAIAIVTGTAKRTRIEEPVDKPHGRKAWTLYFTQEDVDGYNPTGPYLDISVMPRMKP